MRVTSVAGATTALIDEILPAWHFREVHTTRVAAPRARVFSAVREITPREAPIFRLLMALRSLPGRLGGDRSSRLVMDEPLLDQFLSAGFAVLALDPEKELVVGTIARFWEVRGARTVAFRGPEGFATFDAPGFAKTALNLTLEERGRATLLRTETRILATDEASRRSFARYWALIRWGSGAIRREWLAAAKRRAERDDDRGSVIGFRS